MIRFPRYAELVSASKRDISPTPDVNGPAWILKQVQDDDGLVAAAAQKLLGISLEGSVR